MTTTETETKPADYDVVMEKMVSEILASPDLKTLRDRLLVYSLT